MQKAYINILDSELAQVKEIYTRYYRGKWYFSDTPQQGYEKEYYVTKIKNRAYYSDKEDAQARADQYNKRYIAAKYGARLRNVPDIIKWDEVKHTEIGQETLWPHQTGDWLYEHRHYDNWDSWPVQKLLNEDMEEVYNDKHTNVDFFKVVLRLPKYHMWFLQKVGYKKVHWTAFEFVNGQYKEVEKSKTIADYGLFMRK